PLIYCINQLLICFAFSVAIFLTLSEQKPLKDVLRPKFQIDMGSFMLALTLIWSYMNFAQYMLTWIGNLPEEIPYYLKRTGGGWGWYAALAVVFHFPIPFLLLLFRRVKSSPSALRNISIMLIVVVFFDVMWWISPSLNHAG